ncbi:MAG: carboxylating nicotinate-nucleotide diphosphorylase [Archangium sp.]|nr:carboxylating nicotinate-nucleotide diphosphorylase [Archangium sp.]MDP3152882.1 carboxylating nicotinate-nucleotide diphosphorylase [Archangium sp.]MDP3569041.1 carboxylating nicotinate-nucleotide diphosphorylase [Archangium sp.]
MNTFIDRLIDLALDEDLGSAGDVTTSALVPAGAKGRAELWAKEPMVLSGLGAFVRTFEKVDPSVQVKLEAADGDKTSKRQRIATLTGPLQSLLIGERTALNIVQRCAGMATAASAAMALIEGVKGSKLKILDTRKTPPGMRGLAKQAVRDGGAFNHRFGLFDGVLIKDNHIAAVGGSIAKALARARANAPRLVKIEIEVTTLEQLREAIQHGAHIVMLDNMDDAKVKAAVAIAAGKVELEVSGGVTAERLPKLATLGVDYVSMGALTHSARAMDLSLEILVGKGG